MTLMQRVAHGLARRMAVRARWFGRRLRHPGTAIGVTVAGSVLLIYLMAMQTGTGVIIVSEPDIYTRERLVNDRFREEYWLRSQLDQVDALVQAGAFDAIQGLSTARATSTVRLATTGGVVPEATPTTAEQRKQELQASQIDRLKDSMAYRDAIRSELMVTQLDDRHDIAGNTLIRLDFDVTVLPAARSAQTALVLIEASGLPLRVMADYGISQQLYDDWTKHLQKIFDDTSMALISLQNINNLEAMPGSKRLLDHFALYARRSNIQALKKAISNSTHVPIWLRVACQNNAACMAEWVADRYYAHYRLVLDRLLLQDFFNILSLSLEAPVMTKPLESRPSSAAPAKPTPYHFPKEVRDKITERLTDDDNRALKSLLLVAIQDCQRSDRGPPGVFHHDIARLIDYELPTAPSGLPPAPQPGTPYALPCPQSVPEHLSSLRTITALHMILSARPGLRTRPVAADLLAFMFGNNGKNDSFVIDALFSSQQMQSTLTSLRSSIVHELPPTVAQYVPIDENMLSLFRVFPEPADYSFLIANFMQHRMTEDNDIAEIALKTKTGTPLSSFLTTYIDGCETLKCRLSIRRAPERDGRSADLIERYCRSAQLISELKRANFDRKSGDSGGLFVYNVYPKQLVEQYASTVASRQLIGLATEVGAGAIGADSFATALGILSDTDKQLDALQRYPVVVGFSGIDSSLGDFGSAEDERPSFDIGEGPIPVPPRPNLPKDLIETCQMYWYPRLAGVSPPQSDRKAPGVSKDEHAIASASFGWIVRPGLDPTRPGFAAQSPAQRAVSATLSVPTWWPAMTLTVTTCWLDETSLPRVTRTVGSPKDLCGRRGHPAADHPGGVSGRQIMVELPTSTRTTAEISRTIGIEVVKEPYLVDAASDLKTLEIGRPGELILEGGRLWKSTMVTLGDYQRADEIVVLPSMEGIIARFNCVRPPPDSYSAGLSVARIGTDPSAAPVEPLSGKTNQKVVVWTSEGRTDPLYIELHPFQTFSVAGAGNEERLAQSPCWLAEPGPSERPVIPRQSSPPPSPSVFTLAADVIRRLVEPTPPPP